MASKADRYNSKSEIDELGNLSEKLAGDLRRSIRQLVRLRSPPFLQPHFAQCDSLTLVGKLSHIVRSVV